MAHPGIQLLVWLAASACNGAPGAYALNIDKRSIDPLLKAYWKSRGYHERDRRLNSVRGAVPECGVQNEKDMYLPIAQVQARYPNKDMWCHFGFVGPWVSQCAVARKLQDYGHYYREISNGDRVIRKKRPPWRIKFGKYELETRDHWHPLDDTLCVATGFYDIPRDEIFDWAAMNDRSYDYCHRLLHDNRTQHWANMSFADLIREDIRDSTLLHKERMRVFEQHRITGSRTVAVVDQLKNFEEGMLQHEVAKCLLGTSACDMAYCAGRGCLRADGRIVYSPTKECPDLPLGRMADVKNKRARSHS